MAREIYQAIVDGEDPHRIALDWQNDLEKFEQMKAQYVIYK